MKSPILHHFFLILLGVLGTNSDYAQPVIPHISYPDAVKHVKTFTTAINDTSSIDSLIRIIMEDNNVAGVSACIIKEKRVVWNRSYGFANIEQSIPVTDTTAFMLASVSKTITGAALLKLWENGLFNLNDDVNDYLPFRIVNPYYPDSSIMFRMLLTHTSGIKDNWDVMFSTYVSGDTPIPLDSYVRSYFLPGGEYYSASQNFYNRKPGKYWTYCNHNFVLIGYLVSVISNMPFDRYCRDSVFIPLNMKRTSWFLHGFDTNTVAMPYHYNGFSYIPYGHFGYADFPAGALRSSSVDLAKFLIAHFSGNDDNGFRMLEKETLDSVTTIQYPAIASTQGLTWFRAVRGPHIVWEHNGGDQGVRTKAGFCRQDSCAVVVLTNGESTLASETIYSILWDAVFPITTVKPQVRPDEIIQDFTLAYNYPNPFNGNTAFHLKISRSTVLTARIYDINGRLLKTIFESKPRTPGNYAIVWDGKDQNENEANSGLYFCRMESQVSSQVIKLLLIR